VPDIYSFCVLSIENVFGVRRSMKRAEKEGFVSDIRDELSKSSTVIAVNRSFGITVGEMTKLRRDMRDAKSNFKVLKNTLARIAIKDSALEQLSSCFEGPTALAYSNSPVEMSKVVSEFAKTNERFTILGGVMDGKFISPEGIKELASLPSLDELKARIVGLLQAVATKIVRTINEPAGRIARVIAARD
jgi:large subunit ribosomal protein L10